jgi:hypothetical protein
MMVGGAHGEIDPNSSWFNSKGVWMAYLLGVLIVHFILLMVPFLSVSVVWTLTNLIHNLVMFFFLHTVKGTPWVPNDQGMSRRLTHWEQIDCGEQMTATRKFLTVVPIVLFFLTSFYTKYDSIHFSINVFALVLVLLPKLPQFHLVRLFGINKY